jgi:hypothetical protein
MTIESNWLAELSPAGITFKESYYISEAEKFSETIRTQVRLFYGVDQGIKIWTPPSLRADHYLQILNELNVKGFKATGPIKQKDGLWTEILWGEKPESARTIGEIQ